jgi:hypothetical protein
LKQRYVLAVVDMIFCHILLVFTDVFVGFLKGGRPRELKPWFSNLLTTMDFVLTLGDNYSSQTPNLAVINWVSKAN